MHDRKYCVSHKAKCQGKNKWCVNPSHIQIQKKREDRLDIEKFRKTKYVEATQLNAFLEVRQNPTYDGSTIWSGSVRVINPSKPKLVVRRRSERLTNRTMMQNQLNIDGPLPPSHHDLEPPTSDDDEYDGNLEVIHSHNSSEGSGSSSDGNDDKDEPTSPHNVKAFVDDEAEDAMDEESPSGPVAPLRHSPKTMKLFNQMNVEDLDRMTGYVGSSYLEILIEAIKKGYISRIPSEFQELIEKQKAEEAHVTTRVKISKIKAQLKTLEDAYKRKRKEIDEQGRKERDELLLELSRLNNTMTCDDKPCNHSESKDFDEDEAFEAIEALDEDGVDDLIGSMLENEEEDEEMEEEEEIEEDEDEVEDEDTDT